MADDFLKRLIDGLAPTPEGRKFLEKNLHDITPAPSTPTPRDIELARAHFDDVAAHEQDNSPSTHEDILAMRIAIARAEERERCCKLTCAYCDMGWPMAGQAFHRNPGGEYEGMREFTPCAAKTLRTQGAPDAKPE